MSLRAALVRVASAAAAVLGFACDPAAHVPPPPVEDAGGLVCPTDFSVTSRGLVIGAGLVELSGLAASRANPGVLWTHGDSGSLPRLFALRSGDAAHIGSYEVAGVPSTDWEDIAIGPHQGADAIFIGDIGDNAEERANVRVYIVPEPAAAADQRFVDGAAPGAITLTLTYPDGPHDAETLMVDPRSGDLYIMTKTGSGTTQLFVKPAPHQAEEAAEVEIAGVLQFGQAPLVGATQVTAGSIAPDGARVLVRTYDSAFMFLRGDGASIADTLLSEQPCSVPLAAEVQGEAIGFAADGHAYFSLSENPDQDPAAPQPLWRYAEE